MAALWVQPAQAVTIELTSPTPGVLAEQKITLTGLTAGDAISAIGYTGSTNAYWWEYYSGVWSIGGNGAGELSCYTGNSGACHEELVQSSLKYPVSLSALIDIKIVGDEIFVDWFKSPSVMFCPSIPENERIPSAGNNKCGFVWQYPYSKLAISLDVTGPSAQTFGYSVLNVEPPVSPVPEPATWALLILGIGFAGVAMRRHTGTAPEGTVVPKFAGLQLMVPISPTLVTRHFAKIGPVK